MTVYLFLIGMLLIFATVSWVDWHYSKNVYNFCFFILFALMALRGSNVGTDTSLYISLFNVAGQSSWINCMNVVEGAPLYGLYTKTLYSVLGEGQILLIANSVIICFAWWLLIKELVGERVYPVLLFVFSYQYFTMFNTMRQGVAIALLMLAFVSMRRKQYQLMVALVAIGGGVHPTSLIPAIIVGLCWVISRHRLTFRNLMILISGFVILILLYKAVIPVFLSFFPRYAVYFAGNGITLSSDVSGQGRYRYLFLLLLMIFLSCCFFSSQCANNLDRFLRLMTVSTCISGLLLGNYDMFSRLLNYFMPYVICCLSGLTNIADSKTRSVLFRGVPICILAIMCIYMLNSNYGDIVPYVPFEFS